MLIDARGLANPASPAVVQELGEVLRHRKMIGRVEFIVVGGVAARAHGSARLTNDLDVLYRRTPENIAAW